MSEAAVDLQSCLRELFLSEENLMRADESVFEIFGHMLGMPVDVISNPPLAAVDDDERTAIVGYSGAMHGYCEIQMNEGAAGAIASAMLGIPVEDAESLADAVGEMCNMIAGGWKDRIPSLSFRCALSPPTVVTGKACMVHISQPSTRMSRCYRFDGHFMFLTLHREDAPAL